MRKSLAAAALLYALTPHRALAQLPTSAPETTRSTESIDKVRKDYRIHAGPFYVNPAILLKELGVDTNVFNAAEAQKSDFTFTIAPQADIAVPIARRALLRTVVGTDVVYYAEYESERSVDPQVSVHAEAYARRLTFFAEGEYLNTRQRLSYEIDVRARHVDNNVAAGVNVQLTPKTAVEIAARGGRIRFDGDAFFQGTSLKETLDQDTRGFAVVGRHKLTSLTTLAAKYDRLQERFPLSPIRDTNSYRVMPGVEFKPKALISGVAYVGYRSFTPLNPALPAYTGLVSQVGLSYTLLGSTTFGVTADRDVAFSFEEQTPYYVDNGYGVFVRRAMGGKWDVIANAARHRYSYRSIEVEALDPAPERVDVTDNFGANLGYRLKKETRVGFGAAYYIRSSNVKTFRDYDGLRVGTTVTYGF